MTKESPQEIVITTLPEKAEVTVEKNKTATQHLSTIELMTVDSQDMSQLMVDVLQEVKADAKAFDTWSKTFTDPLNLALKRLRNEFSKTTDIYDIAERTGKRKIADFANAERARVEAEERRIAREAQELRDQAARELAQVEAAVAEGKAEVEDLEHAHLNVEIAEITTPAAQRPVGKGKLAGAGSGVKYVVELQDDSLKSLAKLLRFIADDLEQPLPRFTNTIDVKWGQLQQAAQATKGELPIPGCVIKKDTKVSIR